MVATFIKIHVGLVYTVAIESESQSKATPNKPFTTMTTVH